MVNKQIKEMTEAELLELTGWVKVESKKFPRHHQKFLKVLNLILKEFEMRKVLLEYKNDTYVN